MRRALLLLGMAQATRASADSSVTVTLNAEGERMASRLGISVPELTARADAKIEELYKVARLDELLHAFADTGSFAQRTVGVDYDIDRGDIVVGVAAVGAHADIALGTTNSLLGGSIATISSMAGVNLGRWHHPRWSVFANGFYVATTIRGLTGHLLTLGSHVQYQVLAGSARARARWTGVALTSGLEYSRWSVGEATGTPIDSHFTAEGTAGGVVDHYTVHMSSTGTLDVTSTTLTVPLEVTTGVRLFDYLALYGGGGLDLTAGSSKITTELDSLLTYTGDRIPVGNALITASGEDGPSTFTAHALVGVAIHARHLRVFLQGAVAPGETGISLGARGAL